MRLFSSFLGFGFYLAALLPSCEWGGKGPQLWKGNALPTCITCLDPTREQLTICTLTCISQ